eukprot:scaffold100881_cov28-Tisochrysis_lutea.AAC.4
MALAPRTSLVLMSPSLGTLHPATLTIATPTFAVVRRNHNFSPQRRVDKRCRAMRGAASPSLLPLLRCAAIRFPMKPGRSPPSHYSPLKTQSKYITAAPGS